LVNYLKNIPKNNKLFLGIIVGKSGVESNCFRPELKIKQNLFPKINFILGNNAVETPRITVSFSLASRLGNVLILFLQTSRLKIKNLLKQAWQIF
jgi:hypothetical protein